MVLPIYGYGHPVLKKKCEPIDPDYPGLNELIENMWETLYHAKGIGLAAPQVGIPIRLFLVDTKQLREEGEKDEGIKKVFINAEIIEEKGDLWSYEEGCLSIPQVRGDVERPPQLYIHYQDKDFEEQEKHFSGVNARVVQHEYDHIEGILFTDLLKPVKRRMVRRKLNKIRKGKVKVDYSMKFAE